MTRREEIMQQAELTVFPWDDVREQVKFEDGFIEGAKWADKTMIDKACEILKNVTVTYNRRFFGKCEENAFDADFIKEFRKAMEE